MSAPATPRSGVHGHGRRLLLEAARALFAEKGYSGASTREIADRAGVSETMLFRHFGSKANLFEIAAVAPFTAFMKQYVDDYRHREHGDRTPLEEGRGFYRGLFTVLHGERELLMALRAASQFDQVLARDIGTQLRAAFTEILELFEEVVGSEIRERELRSVDCAATVRVMVGMTLSLALFDDWLMVDDSASHDRMLEEMANLSVYGVLHRPV
jgi:AcrR family transcriptional regulator